VANPAEKLFHCPSHPWPLAHANDWMRTAVHSLSSSHYGWPMDYNSHKPVMVRTSEPCRTDEIPGLSRAVLLGETAYNNPTRRNRGEGGGYFGVFNGTPGGELILDKHQNSGNYAFLDGHVAAYRADDILSHAFTTPGSPVRFSWPDGTY
jgi:prepilin-type processing-associated H-X9-DG protein